MPANMDQVKYKLRFFLYYKDNNTSRNSNNSLIYLSKLSKFIIFIIIILLQVDKFLEPLSFSHKEFQLMEVKNGLMINGQNS